MIYFTITVAFYAGKDFIRTIKYFSPAKLVVLSAFAGLLIYFYTTRPETLMNYENDKYEALCLWLILLSMCWFRFFEGLIVGFIAYSLFSPAPFTLAPNDIPVLVACCIGALVHFVVCQMGGKVFWVWATLLNLFYSGMTLSLFGLIPSSATGVSFVWEPLWVAGIFLIGFASFTLLREQSQWLNGGDA